MHDTVYQQEEVSPRNFLRRPVQVHARPVASADEKFFNSHFIGKLFKGFLGVADRQWHENGAGPGRNLIDVEPEPVGKEHNLRRNGRTGIVVVLAEEAEIELGESIDFGDPTELENSLPGELHRGMLTAVACKLQAEIRLH